jgi:hypothetical protein
MSTLKVSTLQNLSGTEVYTCKAWVNFNGTGTVAIRASGNVSSITDAGTGLYLVNLTTAMPDINYSVTMSAANTFSNADSANNLSVVSTTQIQWQHIEATATRDSDFLCLSVFR